jgi:Fe2+ or Zn2+ uptake regulation protein
MGLVGSGFIDSGRVELMLVGINRSREQSTREHLERSLEVGGLRCTRQRREVFEVVAGSFDHPTADEIFERAKKRMPEISFATVYNCLSVLVRCGLVRQVTLDRSPTRFCPNMREHCHFFCEDCGEVTDIELPERSTLGKVRLPKGFEVATFDLSLRGVCPKCGRATERSHTKTQRHKEEG